MCLIFYYCSLPSGADASANQLTFRFNYLPLWTEILKIVNRESREVAASSEHVLSDYLTAMVDFLHGARQYIRTDGKFHNACLYIHFLKQFPSFRCMLSGE